MDKLTVSKSFVLEGHMYACPAWKKRIEEEFPELFPREDLVLYQFIPFSRFEHIQDIKQNKEYYLPIGQKIQIIDGSYHLNTDGSKIKESLGLTRPKGEIVYNKCKEFYEFDMGKSSLNLVIKLDDGRTILSSPNCVSKI